MIATHFITTKIGETATTVHLAKKFRLNISITLCCRACNCHFKSSVGITGLAGSHL